MDKNLNKLFIERWDSPEYLTNIDRSNDDIYHHDFNNIKSGNITVHFNNLQQSLIKYIKNADFVVGCVAWLTNGEILDALALVNKGASLVIQKEDFLRPDINKNNDWTKWLRTKYDKIFSRIHCRHIPGIKAYNTGDGEFETVNIRCMGNHNSNKTPAFPRMHNKFLVFCKHERTNQDEKLHINPYAVWTGSFNFTQNSVYSLENAVYIEDKLIAERYFDEWAWIYGLSEELDWKSQWVEPIFRIGT